MATIDKKPTVIMNISLGLNEQEATALYTLTLWGKEAFLKAIESYLGSSEFPKVRYGLTELFSVAQQLAGPLEDAKKARYVFTHPNEASQGSQKKEALP